MISLKDQIQSAFESTRDLMENIENRDRKNSLVRSQFHSSAPFNMTSEDQDTLLSLNAGGKVVVIRRSTLAMIVHENRLSLSLCGPFDHLFPKDIHGKIFLNISDSYVEDLFNMCRDLVMRNGDDACPNLTPSAMAPKDEQEFKAYSKYFASVSRGDVRSHTYFPSNLFIDSVILKELDNKIIKQEFMSLFEESNMCIVSTELLYTCKKLDVKAFHQACDDKPHTVCLIRDTEGNVIGGYTPSTWESCESSKTKTDSQTFLFTLAEKGKARIIKHKKKLEGIPSIWCHRNFGCAYGGDSSDLFVTDTLIGGQWGKSFDVNVSSNTGRIIGVLSLIEVYLVNLATDPAAMDIPAIAHSKRKFDSVTDIALTDCDETMPLTQLQHAFKARLLAIKEEEALLLADIKKAYSDLCFIARFTGVDISSVVTNSEEGDSETDVETMLTKLQGLRALLETHSSALAAETVTINAGGRIITTTKATLQLTPEGSPLYNMASDAWGHDLDSDGNIYQDVNSDLFVSIINHLRLKVLLNDTNIEVPPIVVHEDQKTALNNLLSFYMLGDGLLPLKTFKHSISI